ncbi:DeoR/GlpR family DNA-binding transcription regulator [Salinarimonas rosea]|uniref:DeoR/GlpR family DNA-binding transcription regulator n=1 Tax=Salinarimonas rosea TaxID=552063 RepID=UPI0003FC59CA|nr:DeoR/GlpR family DNA-binding transcription regulator [Salinarimonas rosea]
MLTEERHALIAERLRSAGSVVARALAAELAVSEDTIRRDLRALEARGVCERVHGGALASPMQPLPRPARERTAAAGEATAHLGAAAAALAPADALVFIDAGSSSLAVAAALPRDRRLTVATNAPAIAALLYDRPGVSTILVGGRVDPLSGACVGADTVAAIARLRPALAYIGACAVDAADGLTAFGHEEALVKAAIAEAAGAVAVAATPDKLGTHAPFRVAPAARITHLVTTARSAACDALADAGVSVHVVEVGA